MVEVFKTNVYSRVDASSLALNLVRQFNHYKVNFDLDDSDHILRIESVNDFIDVNSVIEFLFQRGFRAEPLSDEIPDHLESLLQNL
jgi:hypothetical protein